MPPIPSKTFLRGLRGLQDDLRLYSADGSHLGGINQAGAPEARATDARFAPGTPDGLAAGPNPRTVSNIVVAGDNPEGGPASGFLYAFGQFLDHDLDRTRSTGADISITIPEGDPFFTPGSLMVQTRAQVDPATGTQVNAITGWLDLSQVYGSDPATAAALRGTGGRLLTSPGDHLPVVDGQFFAGDVRAAENPALTAIHELFLREHNRLADAIRADSPKFSDETVYQIARAINIAQYQQIIYSEFLPQVLGSATPGTYGGFNASVDPRITQEFAGAAFRFGHTTVSGDITGIDNEGEQTFSQTLAESFGEPAATFVANGGSDPQLRHLASEVALKFDTHIIEDLRNLLADPTATQDLAALNINRGRDLGFGTLNDVREDLGLPRYQTMDQLAADPATAAALTQAYGTVDAVELWIGGLAERPANGGVLGETMATIVGNQFEALRDGDPLWWQNQDFPGQLRAAISNTSLSDLIVRNTDTDVMQANAFIGTERHASDVAPEDLDLPQLVIGIDANNAKIVGGELDDTLVAGEGLRQVLTGGDGADTFVFLGKHVATISDFQPGTDKLSFGDDVRVRIVRDGKGHGHGGDAVVVAGDSRITLAGVSVGDVKHTDLLA